ncbi:hypothetical protein DM860_006481 [Cuscuta australis]|uniref:Expansin n=1 Tax=Cuscuta australis TaxID=267555 RepID=A0A328D7W1_9ASTE|nr:hypothetical protein DM860_006481 [Cuscuta australis]
MASYSGGGNVCMRGVAGLVIVISLVLLINVATNANADDVWLSGAHATFYGSPPDTPDNMGGACGYDQKTREWYGDDGTTALSFAWFNEGLSCGQCFEIMCDSVADPQWCIPGKSVTVTATNSCPPGGLGWCNPPKKHFDMAVPAWVRCQRNNGVRFTITKSSQYFSSVLISNVGGAGAVTAVSIKGSNDNVWSPMKRNYGQIWQIGESITGQDRSFMVKTEDHLLTYSHPMPILGRISMPALMTNSSN